MRMVTTTKFELCNRCGEPVARLRSERTGNDYSVRIDGNNIINGSAVVGVSDFHNCDQEQVKAFRAAKAAEATKQTAATTPQFVSTAAFFRRATDKGAKRITITLHANERTMLELKYSKNRNVIYITDGRGFGTNEWYGSINMDGSFAKGRNTIDAVRSGILNSFELDPVATAISSARITSNCSFCRLPLDDERSVTAGYGPVCAKKYGLPWGNNSFARAKGIVAA